MCGGRGGNGSTRCSPKFLRIRNAHKTQGSASLQPPALHKPKGQQIVTFLTVHDLFNFDFFSLHYKVNESLCCTSAQRDCTAPLFTDSSHKATLITLTGKQEEKRKGYRQTHTYSSWAVMGKRGLQPLGSASPIDTTKELLAQQHGAKTVDAGSRMGRGEKGRKKRK